MGPLSRPNGLMPRRLPCGSLAFVTTTSMTYAELKSRQREIRDGFPESMSVRVHRALSWLQRSEHEGADADARFIFLWIAFNAAYAQEFEDRQGASERQLLVAFLDELIAVDRSNALYDIVWRRYPGAIRQLIDNKYVFKPFWDYAKLRIPEQLWLERFEQSKQ